jgi:hypothetical protein
MFYDLMLRKSFYSVVLLNIARKYLFRNKKRQVRNKKRQVMSKGQVLNLPVHEGHWEASKTFWGRNIMIYLL